MHEVKADLDYDAIQRAGTMKVGQRMYRASVGSHSKAQAEQDAKYFLSKGHTDVKIIVCRSYFACIPEEEAYPLSSLAPGASRLFKATTKTVKQATRVVHNVSGEILTRNANGEKAVKKILGWEKKPRSK